MNPLLVTDFTGSVLEPCKGCQLRTSNGWVKFCTVATIQFRNGVTEDGLTKEMLIQDNTNPDLIPKDCPKGYHHLSSKER